MADVGEYFRQTLPRLLSDRADSLTDRLGVMRFEVEAVGTWTLTLMGSPKVVAGDEPFPTCTVAASERDFGALIDDPSAAWGLFLQGRLHVDVAHRAWPFIDRLYPGALENGMPDGMYEALIVQPGQPNDSRPEHNRIVETHRGRVLLPSGVAEVTYAVWDGLAVVEGDIILATVTEMKTCSDILHGAVDGDAERATAAVDLRDPRARRWPRAMVPYRLNVAQPIGDRAREAMAMWEDRTPVRFVQHNGEANCMEFVAADGCYSWLGMRPNGPQRVFLSADATAGNAAHEIGHALGLMHEHSRSDRDEYVEIRLEHVRAGHAEAAFGRPLAEVWSHLGGYDYDSIMHWSPFAYATRVELSGPLHGHPAAASLRGE